MAHGGGGGADFHLPDEILSVIPTDPYDQLDLARRITGMAIASRVSVLEADADRMRHQIEERDRAIDELEDRLSQLDRAVQDSDARLRAALEDNIKLSRERDMLTMTTKKLGRDLAKLETFKRHLMQSLSDDNLSPGTSTGTFDKSVASSSLWKDEVSISQTVSDTVAGFTGIGDPIQYVGTPRGYSTAGSSPKILSGTVSPTKNSFEEHTPLSSWYPSSQHLSAPSSPLRRRSLPGPTRVDGKEFFRQARSRLSYEQFGAFLMNVKELNAKRQSREETLENAEEIFGTENKDLFISFQGLLNRNLP